MKKIIFWLSRAIQKVFKVSDVEAIILIHEYFNGEEYVKIRRQNVAILSKAIDNTNAPISPDEINKLRVVLSSLEKSARLTPMINTIFVISTYRWEMERAFKN